MSWSVKQGDTFIELGSAASPHDQHAAAVEAVYGPEEAPVDDRVSASYIAPRFLRDSRPVSRWLGLGDWATVTTSPSSDWFDSVWYTPQVCGETGMEAGRCADQNLSNAPCIDVPCPVEIVPFASTACVNGNPFRGDTVERMDQVGFTILSERILTDVAEVLYTGARKGVTVKNELGVINPHVTMDPLTPPGTVINVDLTPVSGGTIKPVSLSRAIGALSKALACAQPRRGGVILAPFELFLGINDARQHLIQTGDNRYRTRAGDGVVVDCAFDGRGPGATAAPTGNVLYLWAVGTIDVLLSRPFSPQALQPSRELIRYPGGATVPDTYRVSDSKSVFQNRLRADYIQQAAVAMSGCARFTCAVDLCASEC